MTYKDELFFKLKAAGIKPTEEIINFIDLETIPLKSELFIKRGEVVDWDSCFDMFNNQALAHNVIGFFQQNGYTLIKK